MSKNSESNVALTAKEVRQTLRSELDKYVGYLPNSYSQIVQERLTTEYPLSAIRKTKVGQLSTVPILTELVKLAKEEYKKVNEAINQ